LLELAPAFNTLYGSLSQISGAVDQMVVSGSSAARAMEAMATSADALANASSKLDQFRIGAGLTTADEVARKNEAAALKSLQSFSGFYDASAQSLINITNEQFAALSQEQQGYVEIVLSGLVRSKEAADSLRDASEKAAQAAAGVNVVSVGDVYSQIEAQAASYAALVAKDTGSTLAAQFAKQLELLTAAQSRIVVDPNNAGFSDIQKVGYQNQIDKAAASLAKLATLTAQYGSGYADKVFALQSEFEVLFNQFANEAPTLAYVTSLYQKQRDAILATGEALQESTKTIESIIDSLRARGADSLAAANALLIGDQSTLSVSERYQEAKRQRDLAETIARANPLDKQAFGDFKSLTDSFLGISRELNTSGGFGYRADFADAIADFREIAVPQIDFTQTIAEAGIKSAAGIADAVKKLEQLIIEQRANAAAQINAAGDNANAVVRSVQSLSTAPTRVTSSPEYI
jgi:hypothetical protein